MLMRRKQSRQALNKSFIRDRASAKSSHRFIPTALSQNQLTASRLFIAKIESRIGIPIEYLAQSRQLDFAYS
jgi:hypothetical protein